MLMTGFLFVPAILTPPQQQVKNPTVKINANSAVANVKGTDRKAQEDVAMTKGSGIQLESVDGSQATGLTTAKSSAPIVKPEDLAGSATESSMMPIKLESLGVADGAAGSGKKTDNFQLRVKKKESWLRVGSFSNLKNADKLAEELKRKKYSVKIENTSISGTPYRRVLIGPFNSDKETRKALEQMKLDGFTPSLQN